MYNYFKPGLMQRRHPLTNAAINHNVELAPHPAPPPKAPGEPPLSRQNTNTAPPSPPKIIVDISGRRQYDRVAFLGEGGFARVYEVKDIKGSHLACKVVTKSSLKTKKAKTKLYSEIKIHKSLKHPNIVSFRDCFEDEDNVYITLELCPSGSLMDVLRTRRRLSEPEIRFFVVQLVGACHYLHTHQVIHRDLKLGNLFLDAHMNIKVGDFGLAALIENPGERKKTICGTPNYIAPEVLFDTANGHSFEVDTWSIGVIIYTLIVGKPPFQTKDVKEIYQRIRDNVYEFPSDRVISSTVQNLIQQILTPNPAQRPSLHEIINDPFFTQGPVPAYIPTSAHESTPDFRSISKSSSDGNLKRLKKYCLLDIDPTPSNSLPSSGSNSSLAGNKNIASSIAQQEKEFRKAVQPGSPISALLSSARQPLVMVDAPAPGHVENQLLKKLQSARERSVGRRLPARGLEGIIEESDVGSVQQKPSKRRLEDVDFEEGDKRHGRKELEAQKARIVAQMAPVREEQEQAWEVISPVKALKIVPKPTKLGKLIDKENVNTLTKAAAPGTRAHIPPPAPKPNTFDAVVRTLTLAFDEKDCGRVFEDPRNDLPLPEERVFLASWMDFTNRYGMAFTLTDGTAGVHFNDSTNAVMSPDKKHFDYITSRHHGSFFVRKSYTTEVFPDEIKSKVKCLIELERSMATRLFCEAEYIFRDVKREKGMEWVQNFFRMKNVVLFKLSNNVVQFNLSDHTKIIFSSDGLQVTYIDKKYKVSSWLLRDIMAHTLAPISKDPEEAKNMEKLVDKLKFCKNVLVNIASTAATMTNATAKTTTTMAATTNETKPVPPPVPASIPLLTRSTSGRGTTTTTATTTTAPGCNRRPASSLASKASKISFR